MKAFQNILVAAFAAASSIQSTAAQSWDYKAKCLEVPPSKGECVLIAYAGVGVVINPGGIENELSDRAAILLDDQCNVMDGGDWVPQNPGFTIELHTPDAKTITAELAGLGAGDIPDMFPKINGIESGFYFNAPTRSFTYGLTAVWIKQTNFWCFV
jgi:hypothetical protein